ncbi:MAG TPA: malto-oligosyltrehalose synthase [Blastocatellia bacterium]|nr:malto-oligosyltrehalose synthase [Blastocatellia bacterium]
MLVPASTYRIQLNSSFTFKEAEAVAEYLADLGITSVYASPIFKARRGSPHGYDVTDPNQINPEVGTREDFDSLIAALHARGMSWLQDFVPNHMAYDGGNHMLMDVFERGRASPYFDFFDITWDHLRENLRGKLIAPFLGGPYGETLEKGELSLEYTDAGFQVRYYETVYPIKVESYAAVISHRLELLKLRLGEEHPDYVKVVGIIYTLENLADGTDSAEAHNAQAAIAKELLWNLFQTNEEVREFISENVSIFNEDRELLDRLLLDQRFRLSYWRVATKEINYQRFFNINELISLRMEDEAVFNHIHGLTFELLREGKISGLRIDHVDGLYNPTEYLLRLRERATDAFIVVEKILELNESLPLDWPVQGTTGYDFMSYANGLFVDSENEEAFTRIYAGFTGESLDYEDLLYEKKKLLIDRHLTGDLDNLTYVLKKISITTRAGIDLTWIGLKRALAEMAALFPVYRTYTDGEQVSEQDRSYIEEAIEKAKGRNAELARELDFIERVLWMDCPAHLSEDEKGLWLSFAMRFQQFTSPLMAKGMEDTTFYIFNRLVSLNEVGGSPARFGISVEEFHAFNRARAARSYRGLNATATHDTKRGEDTRARIDMLSEMPDEWGRLVGQWSELNRKHKREIAGEEVPDKNREYFLYQTLVGAFPFSRRVDAEFLNRIKSYMLKAARESKVHTFWLDPNHEYEEALLEFTEAILDPARSGEFLSGFAEFQSTVAHRAVFNGLAQSLIKITSPGVPDFYQGSELWDLSLVDPDNRRPVDFARRAAYLRQLRERQSEPLALIEELLAEKEDGRIKLFTIYKALGARSSNRQVFDEGDYLPLKVTGSRSRHVIAFARCRAKSWAVIIAPRLVSSLVTARELPLGERVWEDTSVGLPDNAPDSWRHVFTDQGLKGKTSLALSEVFRHFPLGLLIG